MGNSGHCSYFLVMGQRDFSSYAGRQCVVGSDAVSTCRCLFVLFLRQQNKSGYEKMHATLCVALSAPLYDGTQKLGGMCAARFSGKTGRGVCDADWICDSFIEYANLHIAILRSGFRAGGSFPARTKDGILRAVLSVYFSV